MVRLSDIMENETYMTDGFGIVVFGMLAAYCQKEEKMDNKAMEGICPGRILLNDDWFIDITEVKIESAKKTKNAYAYYPNEYLQGKPWTTACTSFAIFSIAYKLFTKELPYLGRIPEELLSTKEGRDFIVKRRKDGILFLADIPASFRDFFAKGLALKKKDRHQAIDDTEDEYSELCENFKDSELTTESDHVSDPNYDFLQSDFDKLFAQSSASDFLLDVQKDEEGSLDDLVGLHDLKRYLRNGVLAIFKNPEKAKKYKLTIPNGLLLYGPPGCGKTAVAEKFAAECRMNYAIIHSKDIASTLVHGTQKIVGQLFQQAAIHAPIVLIFDEVETMMPDRNDPENKKVAEDTNAFLSELSTCAKRGIFVIGTTNRPQFMDSAALRSGRFDKKVYVPLPDEETRTLIFHNYLYDRPIEEHLDYKQLGQITSSGYISSDIKQICDEAARRAFQEDTIITQSLIEQVIRDGSPTVSKNELRSYEESRRYIEPASKCGNYINQIGFR